MGQAVNPGNMNLGSTGGGGSGAGAASIASLGLSAYSSILKGQGTKAANEAQAARAERAAEFGKLQAELTDTHFREELNTTLGNIEVIRAAGHIDPTSPTTAAIEDRQRMLSGRQRGAALLNIRSQIAEDLSSADYLRKAGDFAVSQSYLEAGIKGASAFEKYAESRSKAA